VVFTSNLSDAANSLIPHSDVSHEPWAGLRDLRDYLTASGRLSEAFSLHMALNSAKPKACRRMCRRLLSVAESITFDDARCSRRMLLKEVQVRLKLINTLLGESAEDAERALVEIAVAEERLQLLVPDVGYDDDAVSQTSLYQRLRIARFWTIPRANRQQIYWAAVEILQDPRTIRDASIIDCYLNAATAAKELYQKTGHLVWRRRLAQMYEEKEALQLEEFGCIAEALTEHALSWPDSDIGLQPAFDEEVHRLKEWYHRFDSRYPQFNLPRIAYNALKFLVDMYKYLRRNDLLQQASQRLRSLEHLLPDANMVQVS
jgi:hypothetical protein